MNNTMKKLNTPKTDQPSKADTLPTIGELSTLAAALSAPGNGNAKTLAAAALQLWKASEAELVLERRRQNAINQPNEPTPPLPITNEQLVARLMPHLRGKPADVARTCKAWLRDVLAKRLGRALDDEEANAHYAKCREVEIRDGGSYQSARHQFLSWRAGSTSEKRSEIAKNAWKMRVQHKTGARPPVAKLKSILTESNTAAT
jgi:hypothetical protein